MDDKKQILHALKDAYQRWEALLVGMNEAQLTARRLPAQWSIKDEMAHLMTWQQRSIARLEAGLHNRSPVFPPWPEGLDPNEEEPVDLINTWIYETHRDRPWQDVYRDWREGFLRLLEIGEAMPEENLLEVGRYTWLADGPLAIVLVSSGEHHQEHYEILQDWLRAD
jgi:hypothetical protein